MTSFNVIRITFQKDIQYIFKDKSSDFQKAIKVRMALAGGRIVGVLTMALGIVCSLSALKTLAITGSMWKLALCVATFVIGHDLFNFFHNLNTYGLLLATKRLRSFWIESNDTGYIVSKPLTNGMITQFIIKRLIHQIILHEHALRKELSSQ